MLTPLRVYDATTTYAEATDYGAVSDPALAASPGTYDAWHTPPVVTVPAGSKLKAGQKVSMDYYTVVPQIGWEVSSCLSEPAVQQMAADDDSLIGKFTAFNFCHGDGSRLRARAECSSEIDFERNRANGRQTIDEAEIFMSDKGQRHC